MPGSPYGAYTNPMNDLEGRMGNVDINRARGASVGDYGSKRRVTHVPRPAFLISSVNPQGLPISNRWHRHRPTWVSRTWGIRPKLPQRDSRTLPRAMRRRPGMGRTYTAHPLRTAPCLVTPSKPKRSCRAPGLLLPIPSCPQGDRYMASVRHHPILVLGRTGTDPVIHRRTLVVSRVRSILLHALILVLHRLFQEHPLLHTGSPPTNTLALCPRGPPTLAVARCSVGQNNHRRCFLHPMASVVPRISRSRTRSSIL